MNRKNSPTEPGGFQQSALGLPNNVRELLASVLGTPGASDPELRRETFERMRTGSRDVVSPARSVKALQDLLEKIDERPWVTSEDDFTKLLTSGYSEDQIFELIVAAAAGAGARRLEAGLRALQAA